MSRHFFLAVSFVLCLPALLQAQYSPYRSQPGRQQAGFQPVDIQGTIQGVAKGGIVVVGNNQTWRVALVPATKVQSGTKVQVTGTATADSLRSGLVVELVAELDSHGAVQGKVDTLTITSLTREKQPGLFPSGADSGFGGNGLDDSGKPAKKTGHAGKAAAQTAGSYRVVGLLSIRGGTLSVQPGRGRSALTFQLGEEAKINIDTADLTLVRVGQDVSVKGFASPRQPTMIQATEVKIKLPEPKDAEKAEKKEPATKSDAKDAKKAAKPAKKDDGEGLPEPDAK